MIEIYYVKKKKVRFMWIPSHSAIQMAMRKLTRISQNSSNVKFHWINSILCVHFKDLKKNIKLNYRDPLANTLEKAIDEPQWNINLPTASSPKQKTSNDHKPSKDRTYNRLTRGHLMAKDEKPMCLTCGIRSTHYHQSVIMLITSRRRQISTQHLIQPSRGAWTEFLFSRKII